MEWQINSFASYLSFSQHGNTFSSRRLFPFFQRLVTMDFCKLIGSNGV
ncbi:hypothetical protein CZ765_12645 [Corynebacterium casei]|nr:hypothetical protein CZ765_12645 [Corynebacterium casei]